VFDSFMQERKKKQEVELEIVPILDMFTAIIFFLLISITFVQFTKHALPPSGVTTITEPQAPPPLQPKLYVTETGSRLKLILTWAGRNPGSISDTASISPIDNYPKSLGTAVQKIVQRFVTEHPSESTIQLGLGRNVHYQNFIAVMDNVNKLMPDVVLLSYAEAEAVTESLAE